MMTAWIKGQVRTDKFCWIWPCSWLIGPDSQASVYYGVGYLATLLWGMAGPIGRSASVPRTRLSISGAMWRGFFLKESYQRPEDM